MKGEYSNNILILPDHPEKEWKKNGKFITGFTYVRLGNTRLTPTATPTEIMVADPNSQVL